MSKFSWNKEAVYHDDTDKIDDNLHILTSYKCGMFTKFLMENNIEVNTVKLNPEHYFEICNFYLKQGNDHTNQISIIEPNMLQKFSNLNFLSIQLRKNKELIGCVFITLVPVKIFQNNNSHKESLSIHNDILNAVHTSFLCIHNKYRKQGLGGVLIRQVIEFGFQNIPTHNTKLGIHILQEKKYPCPEIDIYTTVITDEVKEISLNYIKLDNDNYQLGYEFWINNNDSQILFYPTEDYFKRWCSTFNTYIILDQNNNILFLFSLFAMKVLNVTEILLEGYITLFKVNNFLSDISIENDEYYKFIIENITNIICKCSLEENIKLLIIPDIGNFPADIFLKLNVVKNSYSSYFGIYNINFLPKCQNISYPYF